MIRDKSILAGGLGLLALMLLAAPVVPAGEEHAATSSPAARALESFKGLVGEWRGSGSSGQPVTLTYEVLADGSAVMEKLEVQGEHPHDMVTLYHLDGEALMLTHYCAAGNQPRMRATEVAPNQVGFEFLDATNLASPDDGHMRRAVFKFQGNKLVAEWTWRENGEDAFTEVLSVERAGAAR